MDTINADEWNYVVTIMIAVTTKSFLFEFGPINRIEFWITFTVNQSNLDITNADELNYIVTIMIM